MANPIKGEVPLKLSDGRDFVLVMDMGALVEAENVFDRPLQELMERARRGFVGASAALLYGALRAKHPRITFAEAADLMQSDAETVADALAQAVEKGFPAAAETSAEGNVTRPKPSPPGRRSGGSGAKQG